MARNVCSGAEVDQCEPGGLPALDLVERSVPDLQVEVGRRCWRQHEAIRGYAYAGRIAGVQRPTLVEVADVVARMPGRGETVEAQNAVSDDTNVRFRDRCELAP